VKLARYLLKRAFKTANPLYTLQRFVRSLGGSYQYGLFSLPNGEIINERWGPGYNWYEVIPA
jgi:hypothetical protein